MTVHSSATSHILNIFKDPAPKYFLQHLCLALLLWLLSTANSQAENDTVKLKTAVDAVRSTATVGNQQTEASVSAETDNDSNAQKNSTDDSADTNQKIAIEKSNKQEKKENTEGGTEGEKDVSAAPTAAPVATTPPAPKLPTIATSDKVLSGPYYNPKTKSYFAMLQMPSHYANNRWQNAEAKARSSTLMGTPGHLAIIKTYDTHAFIRDNLKPVKASWIGMKYDCGSKTLSWVDGSDGSKQRFKAWHARWHRTNITCTTQHIPFMPVYYLPLHDGFRWQASGPSKEFFEYMVEYPTGKKVH
ncbi:MAG: hypothetical protein CMF31_10890 [Kordiimonas sp.]|nr:hypothetical protein [Kordiimonas sp.]|tara:strand:- start:221 stop:1126 length:906 start_codon:yes stop_codon:yes gene_type:complete